MGTGEPQSVKLDFGFGTILDHFPPWQQVNWGPTLSWAERKQVGLDPKPAADFAAAKIVSRVETLANRVFLERTCAGHEPRTMRLLGWRHHLLIEIRSRDDATRARSGESTTELLRLANVGPFLKAFGTAICQGNIHLG